ncbi:DUF1905 domain-containing protein [Pedobacter jejuensis]|uniref:DUF1905 domain-containing protein n=1 Tax=Pedobacter jejuensis TaxID=1268550 RepID=A0A3N0BYB4_9SPHI|nr:DUF1905 domain-containing protein [Pedobacter jejuensis]RNL54701.1 DUF1905 domain-containing protein [Pedobacter jejuensis]
MYKSEQLIGQLEKRKGGYFYLKIDADIVNQFENKRRTRLICNLDDKISFQCGLNHLGDGNFFIIISTKNLKKIDRQPGETIEFEIKEDPNPLGVDIPEVLEILLEQDKDLNEIFSKLTDGKKRTIIIQTSKIKDIDKQIAKTIELINKNSTHR